MSNCVYSSSVKVWKQGGEVHDFELHILWQSCGSTGAGGGLPFCAVLLGFVYFLYSLDYKNEYRELEKMV